MQLITYLWSALFFGTIAIQADLDDLPGANCEGVVRVFTMAHKVNCTSYRFVV